jgi:hypothetical protein
MIVVFPTRRRQDTPETVPSAAPRETRQRYAALMKNLRTIAPWLTILVLLPTSAAMAQTADQRAADELPAWVAAARCQYTTADAACIGSKKSGRESINTNDETTVAQLQRRIPGPPGRARQLLGYPPAYSGMWMPSPSGRHAAIGALIGFGLGAAVGAKGTGGARVTLTSGVLGGLLGAAFGCMTPAVHVRSPHRRGRWPYDEDELASNSGPSSETSKSGSGTATAPLPRAAPNPGPPQAATAVNDRLPPSAETP